MASSSILWQNDKKTVVLLDLPRSIEEAQVPSSELTTTDGKPPNKLRRLITALPPAFPFPTPEPKKAGGSEPPAASPSAQVAELMTRATVESALEEIRKSYDGPWCLPRITSPPNPNLAPPPPPPESSPSSSGTSPSPSSSLLHHQHHHIPPSSHPLQGKISSTLLSTAPPPDNQKQFNLIILDPPWPNRSAKRKRGAHAYQPAADLASVRALLGQIPVASLLAPGGLVAVWVTNAARFAELLLTSSTSSFSSSSGNNKTRGGGGGGGVFGELWDVELVGEWTWLKVTTAGEPVVGVGSAWRKPWERLLIARRRGAGGGGGGGSVGGKVIVSVPDVHSRKPNLRGLFEELLPDKYEAMEVFARNLTAGWWAWGDEVLLFQRRECWVDEDEIEHKGGGG
ncbi:MT-A70-domain-containing protein [Chaetomidium leptoderma]|uniref:MT-A70-domain-containing protein n=1 Tax=Chaetomidium leptoderma TaxID=669021 RepID=A0AAN6ZUN4_9PEZI|nr:MT-A70-domain-containing protein [Chaetomidium leptoderma]